jgi:predicted O-methyltransferase YrrM
VRVQHATSDLLFSANRALWREARRLPQLDHDSAPPGLLEDREGVCLYVLARRASRLGDVLEIGSYRGRSTWYLARGLEDAASPHRVIAVDPHLEGTQRDFERHIAAGGLADRIDARVAFAHDLHEEVAGPLGVLWIDGDHSYAGARQDFEDWFTKLATGGWLALHDTVGLWHGPTRLALELLGSRADLVDIGVVGTITYARKARPTIGHRARALYARAASRVVVSLRARALRPNACNVADADR